MDHTSRPDTQLELAILIRGEYNYRLAICVRPRALLEQTHGYHQAPL
jgi:hypothetical protein